MKFRFMNIIQTIIFIQILRTSAYPFLDASDDFVKTDSEGSGSESNLDVLTPDPVNPDPTRTATNIPNPPTTTTESTVTIISTTLTTTTIKESQTASILEKYYNWFNNLLGKDFPDYQIILISTAVIIAPIILLIILICVIRRCCRKSEPEYDGPASSFYGGTSGYGSIAMAKQSKRINRRDSGRSMTRGDYDESDAILQTTLDRNKSRKNREMREQIAREFEE